MVEPLRTLLIEDDSADAELLEALVAERRARFLAEAGRVLSAVLDFDEIPSRAAKVAVPELGDYCTIDLISDSGTIRGVAAEGTDAAQARELTSFDLRHATEHHPVVR